MDGWDIERITGAPPARRHDHTGHLPDVAAIVLVTGSWSAIGSAYAGPAGLLTGALAGLTAAITIRVVVSRMPIV